MLLPDPNSLTGLHVVSLIVDTPLMKAHHCVGQYMKTEKPMLLTVPLEKIPRVSSLAISTFCCVSFSRQDEHAGRSEISSLNELRLDGCAYLNAEYLQEVVQSLKDADAWDTLNVVAIRDCGSLDFESALEIVGRERLRFADTH